MKITHLLIFIGLVFGSIITVNAQYTGQSVYTLTVDNTATNIQWYKSNTSGVMAAISGATTANYVASQSGVYYATYNLPTCTGQVSTASVLTSDISKVVLDAGTNNTGATYLWRLNNATIAGQTASTLNPTQYGSYSLNTNGLSCNQFKAFDVYQLAAAITACGGVVGGMQPNDDFDTDGVCNKDDLDDDNDGVLDTDEMGCPAIAQVDKTGVTATTGIAWTYNDPLYSILDESYNIGFYNNYDEPIAGLSIFEFSFPFSEILKTIEIYGTKSTDNSGAILKTAVVNIEGWNGTAWVTVAANVTVGAATAGISQPASTSMKFNFPNNSTGYTQYRILGVSGTMNPVNQWINEADFYKNCIDINTDGDAFSNRFDLDSDADGCSDGVEAGNTLFSANNITTINTGTDTNANGLLDKFEGTTAGTINYTSTYATYAVNTGISACLDSDGDGVPNVIDLDDDNDGILDTVECAALTTASTPIVANGDFNGVTSWNNYGWGQYSRDGDLYVKNYDDGAVNEGINQTVDLTYADKTGGFITLNFDYQTSGYNGQSPTIHTAYMDVILGGVIYARFDVPYNATTGTVTASNGATINVTTYPIYGYVANFDWTHVILKIPAASLPASALLNFDFNAGGNDIGIDHVSIDKIPVQLACDTDGDSIPDYLDLDSDNDGCTDAIEGGASFTNANLVASTMPGGNTGATSGTYNQPVTQNLGNTVGSTATTLGVPTIAGTGQTVGTSANAGTQDAACVLPCTDPTKMAANCDYDGDGKINSVDLDDDNDGILDTVECANTLQSINYSTMGYTDAGISAVGGQTIDLGVFSPIYAGITLNIKYETTNATATATSGLVNTTFPDVLLLDGIAGQTQTIRATLSAPIPGFKAKFDPTVYTNNVVTFSSPGALTSPAPGTYNGTVTVTTNTASNTGANYELPTLPWGLNYSASDNKTVVISDAYGSTSSQTNQKGFYLQLPVPCDTDGDGIVNQFDLDSDNDGCTDAIEGGASFTTANLVTSTMPGGNIGAISGTYNQPVTQNLGNTVDANGVPTIAGAAGQTVGTSANAGTQDAACVLPCNDPTKMAFNCDYDGDGINNFIDLDDDNDGILDTNECGISTQNIDWFSSGFSNAGISAVGGQTKDLGVITGYPEFNGINITIEFLTNDVSNASGLIASSATPWMTISNNSLGTTQTFKATLSQPIPGFSLTYDPLFVDGESIVFTSPGVLSAPLPADAINGDVITSTSILNPVGGSTIENNYGAVRFTSLDNQTIYFNTSVATGGTLTSSQNGVLLTVTRLIRCDTDGDGIANYFDLDSDNDGCTDAIEGGASFITANLVASTMPGGNIGATSGTYNQPVTQNLGNTVGSTATTLGVPTIAGTGQTAGTSANAAALDAQGNCAISCLAGTTAPAITAPTLSNTCPTTTVSLASLANTGTKPAGTTLIWSTHNTPSVSGDTLTSLSVTAGKYYAFYYDKVNNCYSPADSVVVTINTCNSGPCPLGTTIGASQYALTSSGGYPANAPDGKNAAGAPDGFFTSAYNTGTFYAVKLSYLNNFYPGDEVTLTAAYNDGRNDGIYLDFSIDGVNWQTSPLFNPPFTTTLTNYTYKIPTSFSGPFAYIQLRGNSANSYVQVDAVKVTSTSCNMATVNTYLDNGAGGGTSNDCSQNGTEPSLGTASGLFINIIKAGAVVNSFPVGNPTTLSNLADGAYTMIISENPFDVTPKLYTYTTPSASKSISVVNGVITPAPLEFCMQILDSDGDGISDLIDLDDDNDGILDTAEMASATPPTCAATITGQPDFWYDIDHGSPCMTCLETDVDGNPWLTTNFSQYSRSWIPGNGWTIAGGNINGGWTFSTYPTTIANAIANNNYFEFSYTPKNYMTMYDFKSFSLNADVRIDYSTSSNFTSPTTLYTGHPVAPYNFTNFPLTTPLVMKPGVQYFIRVYFANITPEGPRADVDTWGWHWRCPTAGEYPTSLTTVDKDTDGDSIADRLDLDADNDGCTDAIEGGASFTSANLVTSTMPGGNTGATSGSYNQPVTQNLGNTVGNTATTMGVPTIAGTGQTVGTSANAAALDAQGNCPCTDPTKMAANCDYDGDGKINSDDLDDDNDGILDSNECVSLLTAGLGQNPNMWWDINGNGVLAPGGANNLLPGQLQTNGIPTYLNTASTVSYGTDVASHPINVKFGTGITVSAVDTRWRISGATATDLAGAKSNNDYLEFGFTTAAFGTGKLEINAISTFMFTTVSPFGVIDYYDNVGVEISTSPTFATSNALYNGPVIPQPLNNTGLDFPNGGFIDYPASSNVLLPNTTYYARVYFYGETDGVGDFDAIGFDYKFSCDTDGDGIANNFDLDSDNDGCTDAIEGGASFTSANLVTSTIPGGNIGATSGTYNQPVTQNLGNTVDANGVPTIAGAAGQTVGTSANAAALDAQGNCIIPCSDPTKMAADCDYDGDGKINSIDLDDDNDGILDTNECNAIERVAHGNDFTGSGTHVSTVSPWTLNTGTVFTNPNVVGFDDDNLVQTFSQNVSNINLTGTGTILNFNLSIADGTSPATSLASRYSVFYGGVEYCRIQTATGISTNATITYMNGAAGTPSVLPMTTTNSVSITLPNNVPNNGVLMFKFDPTIAGTATASLGADDFYLHSVSIQTCTDTDGDGILNQFDLDTDNDGCTDAIEGGASFTTANLVTSTMPGGNIGAISGTYNQPVTQNLGNTVDANGVPTIAGAAGQTAGTSANAAALDAQGNCLTCNAGTTAPAITATTLSNTCPSTTVSLAALANTGTKPAGTTLIWSTHNTPSVSGDTLTSLSVTAGKYYAFYYDKVNNCYSPADSIVVTITTCTSPVTVGTPPLVTGPVGTTVIGNPPVNVAGGTAPYTYSDGANDPLCTAPIAPTLVLPTGLITGLNASTGAHSVNTTGLVVGTIYQYCIKVCDTSGTNCAMSKHTILVTATCNAGTVAPILIKN